MGRWLRKFALGVALAGALAGAGCSPTVLCTVETVVFPDYTCQRVTRMEGYPNPRFPQQRPRLADYFQFPPAELYDSYAVQQDKVLFAGFFESFEKIPSDLVRNTPGTAAKAGNLLSFRVIDLVLFVLADFDETLVDIVQSREDGESALIELVRLAVPEVMAVLNAKYGAKYDLTRLEAWLGNDLPAKLRRLYAGAWAIHGAKRSGVTSPGEKIEFYMFLVAEARKEGLELAELGTPDLEKENGRRLREYLIRLLQTLCPPRPGTSATGKEMLSGIALDELFASVQSAITARHGSLNNYLAKIGALVPRAFGAYLTSSVLPVHMLPETSYQYRLRAPGQVIQTNGVREMNGDLVWNFSDGDLAFTGQSMWARTIFVREPVTYALGLRGFPASLADVDRLFGLCLTPAGAPREELLTALQRATALRGMGPIEALANNPAHDDAASARGVLELFERHRRAQSQSAAGRERAPEEPPPHAESGSDAAVPAPVPTLDP